MTDHDGLSDAERAELRKELDREKQRLAPYFRKKRIAAFAAFGTVVLIWLPGLVCAAFALDGGGLPIRLMLLVGFGGVAAGAAVHRKLSPASPLLGG